MPTNNTPPQTEKYEHCCLCHKKTNVSCATDIKQRHYYIEGAGQLCEECFEKLFW